ncbi:helix-turn-helix transcriptional regulator [Kitasatospora sp. MAP5-34]|uniref:helix-turn-helix transcriptional regulator n=1 Tax=Kitasatospora sp. MAP5-34 TaxID=3035102 RepID=UPI0024735F4E|nr:helix-turn-helix transcriptional regulator [Kitasatospora sp. MAP5-34]MDH6576951.1 transcriptional regulator with XRE-family HTH domain [Kitasatospora sp. MAP5-34]
MTAYASAAALPTDVLARADMRSALERHDFGEVFALARKWAGISYSKTAEACEIKPERVGKLARGEGSITTYEKIIQIADALRVPGHLLGLAPRPWEATLPQVSLPASDIEGCGGGLASMEIIDSLTRSSVSDAALTELEAAVFRNAALYPSSPPGRLIPTMTKQMVKIHQMLDHSQSLKVRRRSVQLIGVLAGLISNAFLDIGDNERSSELLRVGAVAADEAGDEALMAWLLTMQSIGPFFSRRSSDAVKLLSHAEQLAAAGPARRRAWISASSARAHAAAGNRSAALAALGQAASLLGSADEPSGIDFFNESRLDGIAGSSLFLLGDYDSARDLLGAAINQRAPVDVKGRALLTLDLSECHIRQGEIDEACRAAHAALDIADGSIVKPIMNRAENLRSSLRPWRTMTPVVAFAGRLNDETFTAEN